MSSEQKGYLSYLLRLWQSGDGDRLAWRASLESPQTGERRGFASPDELFEYLRARAGIVPGVDSDPAAAALLGSQGRGGPTIRDGQ